MAEREVSVLERLLTGLTWAVALVVSGTFLWILGDLAWHGLGHVSPGFVFGAVEDAGRAGGILPVLVSTGMILAVCLAVSLPLGVGTALYLSEICPPCSLTGRALRFSLDVLAGVPSIVFGLFGAAFFCGFLGLGLSILSGGLTLTCMILPLLIRTTEEALRAVPDEYRESAAALGLSRRTTWVQLVLPAAAPGMLVALLLSVGRALAETAALLFTSGYVPRMPRGLLDSGRAMSIHIYDLSMNVPGGDGNAYASALVLLVSLLAINLTARSLATRWRERRIRAA